MRVTPISMSTSPRNAIIASVGLAGMLTLTACATGTGPAAPISSAAPDAPSLSYALPAPPTGEVIGIGTVMDDAGNVELCLGPVAESFPPQCSGIPLTGWDWGGIAYGERSDDKRWGAYAVTGTFDGEVFAVTQQPIPLALYDPMAPADPTGGADGTTSEARLLAIQSSLADLLGDDGDAYLASYPERGHLWVTVVWDDGTLQQAADDDFGTGVVIVQSALTPVDG